MRRLVRAFSIQFKWIVQPSALRSAMNSMKIKHASQPKRRGRSGLAVTELAVGLPVMVLVFMATMEVCTMIRLKQKLKMAAYEGARVGALPGSATDNVLWQCETLCDQHGLQDATTSLSPSNPASLDSGDWFQVEVSAPYASNSLTGSWTLQDFQLSESVTIQKP